MTHRAPESEVVAPQPKPSWRRWFRQENLPNWTMLITFVTWLYFQITLGTAGVPGSLNQAFAAVFGLWSSFIIRERARGELVEEQKIAGGQAK